MAKIKRSQSKSKSKGNKDIKQSDNNSNEGKIIPKDLNLDKIKIQGKILELKRPNDLTIESNLSTNNVKLNNNLNINQEIIINSECKLLKESSSTKKDDFKEDTNCDNSTIQETSKYINLPSPNLNPGITLLRPKSLIKDSSLSAIEETLEEEELGFNFSILEYLKGELNSDEIDVDFETKGERVYNFFLVPRGLEKFISFGYLVCLNSVLGNFTLLPIRLLRCLFRLILYPVKRKGLRPGEITNIVQGFLILISCIILSFIDISKLYHIIRGQSMVKLYVIFNMLEMVDKLFSSIGQDLLSSLFTNLTLNTSFSKKERNTIHPFLQILIALFYIPLHTTVLLYQMMALNVSVNSYNDALLSLLMSNQFVEIKGAVFKKFERENLFQLTCSDVVERFQLTIFLTAITLRNITEILNSNISDVHFILPKAFQRFLPPSLDFAFAIFFSPAATILICEILVDWVKHSFLTKFNHIRSSVYERYLDLLCKDLVTPKSLKALPPGFSLTRAADQSPAVARRLGLSTIPLTCLIIQVAIQISNFKSLSYYLSSSYLNWALNQFYQIQMQPSLIIQYTIYYLQSGDFLFYLFILILVWTGMILLKILLGMHLIKYSFSRMDQMSKREMNDNKAAKEDLDSFYKESTKVRKELENSLKDDLYRPKILNLNNIDRFSLFKSRVP